MSSNPVPAAPQQTANGPSYLKLFLTNIRLLDLDLRDDWPDITILTFSTKDSQQNQKKRIRCVEWALYHLFALWDPEETRNKLQPFFPPLEPLQSINLRAALYRCLDHAKKSGVLGRDTVLRKTMLDECKGDRLEEVLSVFSTAVLKKTLEEDGARHDAVARQLAFENFSYTGERQALSSLILAHKVSLSGHIQARRDLKSNFDDFADLMNLKERQLARRQEQWKASVEEEGDRSVIGTQEVIALTDTVRSNWSGNTEWLDTITHGDTRFEKRGLLAESFDAVWERVESGSIGEIEDQSKKGLVEQLDARVREQSHRLAEWKAFETKLTKGDREKERVTSSPKDVPATIGIDFDFGAHKGLQLGSYAKSAPVADCGQSTEYSQLYEDMRAELASVGKFQRNTSRTARRVSSVENDEYVPAYYFTNSQSQGEEDEDDAEQLPTANEEGIPPISDNGDLKALEASGIATSPSPHSISEELIEEGQVQESLSRSVIQSESDMPIRLPHNDSPRGEARIDDVRITSASTYSTLPPSPSSSPLASDIVASVMTTSPSPTKPRHALSLAERTRLSMSRTSKSRTDPYLEDIDDLPNIGETPTATSKTSSAIKHEKTDKYGDLITRTRMSLANMDTVAKNAQIERRRSIKLAEKRKRSSYMPKPLEAPGEETENMLERLKLIEGEVEPDYDSVFKSRPKIKTSPEMSLVTAWGDMGGLREEDFGSSSPNYAAS